MSGFLPDLASWALRGGAGDDQQDNNQEDDNNNSSNGGAPEPPPLTVEEMRAQRLARMQASMQQQQETPPQQAQETTEPEPMDLDREDEKPAPVASPAPAPVAAPAPAPTPVRPSPSPPAATTRQAATPMATETPKKKKKAEPADPNRKSQRKKEQLLKKILSITLVGGVVSGDNSSIMVDLDGSTDISSQSVAEILATRLAMEPAMNDRISSLQKPLIAYLGQCHRRSSEELRTMQQQSSNNSKKSATNDEIAEILREIQKQVVNYASSCLICPELFAAAEDGPLQLGKCLATTVTDPSTSITFGVNGSSTSFYYMLCEELYQQDPAAFDTIIGKAADYIIDILGKFNSVLDGNADGSASVMVSALSALCLHKKAADTLTRMPSFLLPRPSTPEAATQIRPPMPRGTGASLLQMLGATDSQYRPYLRRSGPGLERDTVLGKALRVGVPRTNSAFSPTTVLRLSLDALSRTNKQQRNQLRTHQEACHQFLMSLIKAGAPARGRVMTWIMDALNVNVGASALQPDPSKVSSSSLLLNVSVMLLKLCEPFIGDDKKLHLIDPGFVSSDKDHGGVFTTTGDDAVARLGESSSNNDNDAAAAAAYNPKNKFIPQCFFFCARSLHYGIVPLLSYYENLLRHISHAHYEISVSNDRDMHTDPHFSYMVSKQRSLEVSLYQEEMVTDTLRFLNLMAKVLLVMDDEALRTMPEDFVSDICSVIMAIAKFKGPMLAGVEFRNVFQMVVKLLSARYASMVRNYNLRARLGDVLYELYLPPSHGERRDVPASVSTDPLAFGQTFLLSDPAAQETLAPSLLLLYGEVEHTGYYDKMSHRAKIASLIKYLWESSEHRPAFRRITQNKESFIKFANGIMNETNTLIATVMQKLPEIRNAQERMKNTQEWSQLSEEEQSQVTSRLDDNEREVKHALPLCNKTLQMFGYLNTDNDIRRLFLLDELCQRLVKMLLHVLTKLVGSKGLELKVDNPEQYEFRPKEMLRDLCAIFSLFASSEVFQLECAREGCKVSALESALKTCRRLNLLEGESMAAFEALPGLVTAALDRVSRDDALMADAPDEFLDEILSTYMKDPVVLPSGHFVDRSTITQHLLNDPIDPFSREPMTIDDIKPATELKDKMTAWLEQKQRGSDDS